MNSGGLSIKLLLAIALLATPFCLCMNGGVIPVVLFWAFVVVSYYKQKIEPYKLLEKELNGMECCEDEDWETGFERRCREEGKLSKGQLVEICNRYGFEIKGKYSLFDMNLTIETHKSIEQLHDVGIYTIKDILGDFFFQLNSRGFKRTMTKGKDGNWFADKNNISFELYRYHEDYTNGEWTSDCIYEITTGDKAGVYDVYRDSYVKRGVSESEMTANEREFFKYNRSYFCNGDNRTHWVLNIDKPIILK